MEIARRLLRRADWDAARAGRAFLELSEVEKIQYAASLLSYNLHTDASVEELRARRGKDFVVRTAGGPILHRAVQNG